MNKVLQKIPPLKNSKSSKKRQEEEDKTKKKLTEANQEWCDCNFQIHWNKLEWLNPRNRDERKNPFCVSSNSFS